MFIIREHYSNYETYCKKYNYKKQNGDYADITALMDWSNEELNELGNLSVKYSRISSAYEEIEPTEMQMHVAKTTREFPELMEYNVPEKKCSTSWVTSAIEMAEAALENRIRLSSRQLFECLPEEEGIDKCKGVSTRMLTQYLSETGLMSEDDFDGCESVEEKKRYHFDSISPESRNGGGLMNLVAENRLVFVLVAVDLQKIRFVKDMSNADEGIKCGGYEPSLYGVVTGYKYSERVNGWWEISTHVVPGEEVILKMPMSTNVTNANYAGIAAFAFALQRVDDLPSQTSFTCDENSCSSLEDLPESLTTLVFAANSYNTVTSLDLTRFKELKELTFEDNSFANCQSVLVDGQKLETVSIGNGCFQTTESSSIRRLSDLLGVFTIFNVGNLKNIVIGNNSMGNFKEIVIEGGCGEVEISMGSDSFSNVEQITVGYSNDDQLMGSAFADAIEKSNSEKKVTIIVKEPTPAMCSDLVVSKESDCVKLYNNVWKTITVERNLCNKMTDDLVISEYPCLQKIVVKAGSLNYLNLLEISNNELLNVIDFEDSHYYNSTDKTYRYSFRYVKNLVIDSIMD